MRKGDVARTDLSGRGAGAQENETIIKIFIGAHTRPETRTQELCLLGSDNNEIYRVARLR